MKRRIIREAPRGAVIPPRMRSQVKRRRCYICGAEYGRITTHYTFGRSRPWVPREHLDHIIPCRWITSKELGDANVPVNLLSTCNRCNLGKKGAEDRLFLGDIISFVSLLQARGWGSELRNAARHFGLLDICRLIRT